MGYIPKAERRRRRAESATGVGANNNKKKDRSVFWAGMLMGAATATGGFFALKALEKAFGRKAELNPGVGHPALNPADAEDARTRLMAAATGQPMTAPKPAVTKRTIIEEMVEELE